MSEERQKPTIEELERLLASGEEMDIQLNPDGSITAVKRGTAVNAEPRVLTAKYAAAEYY